MSLKDELKVRSLVALLLIPLVILILYLGKGYFVSLVILAFGMAMWEFLELYGVQGFLRYYAVLLFVVLSLLYYLGLTKWMVVPLILYFLPIPWLWNKGVSILKIAVSLFILVYSLLGGISAIVLRNHLGFKGVLFFLGIIWIFDSMAYISGYLWGKHKLASKISPKKTIEGYIYGIFLTLPFGVLLWALRIAPFTLWYTLLFTLIISVLSQIGDLVESTFKREVGVKDSSKLFPGHGGMLDRIDSIMFTAPYFAFLTWVLNLWR